ncbi:hypothetical protein GLOTRDRAFT_134197 [Gloeophyllum trabeum ATCC 11539]|uniref:Uncharacterized protein n=1 Tax=Gloeophyllum trabeum (strain ATCC 11539 / FP-39264 / Madison 617) TaxID=670483 RepID=S7PRZ9_GLOTA|nr:uncharacterized protein GLOTRDRAFT_134197 [Gloeophyllum trabeum ATCC 11539]EPQ50163.1 hypothetical protein GLOTRDRAFT_134197 [Gloeophyllum trabeum ATCC 11539]
MPLTSPSLPFIFQILPSLFLAAGALFPAFSSHWLASKGRDEECLSSLPSSANSRQTTPASGRSTSTFASRSPPRRRWSNQAPEFGWQAGLKVDLDREVVLWPDLPRTGRYKRTLVGMGLMSVQLSAGPSFTR